jgi:hypothetical protein
MSLRDISSDLDVNAAEQSQVNREEAGQ